LVKLQTHIAQNGKRQFTTVIFVRTHLANQTKFWEKLDFMQFLKNNFQES